MEAAKTVCTLCGEPMPDGEQMFMYHGYSSPCPKPPLSKEKTENVYEGKPDARQGGDIAVSRFRPRYRALNAEEKALHDAIKDKAVELEALFQQVPDGRYKSLSFTALEEAVMWNVKQLTS